MDTVAELCSQCGGLALGRQQKPKQDVYHNPWIKTVDEYDNGPRSVNKEHGRHRAGYKLVPKWDLDGMPHEEHGRYREGYKLEPKWDLDGMPHEKQDNIDAGIRTYLWTPIPLGLKMATRLKEFLEILQEDGQATPDPVVGWKILIPTAGAGGSTIALATTFSSVTAGDFCNRQLVALRHNLHDVMDFQRVKIDEEPINLLDRKDINQFDALVLEPCWGGEKYKTVEAGKLDLYVQSGGFDENTMDLVSMGGPGKDFVLSEGVVPLASVVTRLMYSHPGLRAICILTPYNFNKDAFTDTLHKHGLMYLNIRTHGSPPADLTEKDLKSFVKRRRNGRMVDINDMTALRHYKRYTGPDRYMIIFRKSTFIKAVGAEEGIVDHAMRPASQHAMIQTPFLGVTLGRGFSSLIKNNRSREDNEKKKDEYAERRSDIGPLAQREIREACEFFDMCEADCRNMLDAHYYVWVNRIDPEEEANQQQEQWDDGYDDDDEYPEDHRARGKGGRDEYGRGYDAYQNNGGYQDDGEYQSHDEYHGYNDQHRGNGEDRGDDEDHHTKGFKGDEREIYDEHEKMGRGKNSHPKKLWAPRHPFEGRNDNSKGRR